MYNTSLKIKIILLTMNLARKSSIFGDSNSRGRIMQSKCSLVSFLVKRRLFKMVRLYIMTPSKYSSGINITLDITQLSYSHGTSDAMP